MYNTLSVAEIKGVLSVMLGGKIPHLATEKEVRQRLSAFLQIPPTKGEQLDELPMQGKQHIADFDANCTTDIL